ncbi:MAG: DUF2975 domain-containing protein [Chitinophagaceae bacterium]
MQINISSKQILKILYILAWIIFVGLCVKAGGFFVNAFTTMLFNPEGARHFWKQVDLDALYRFDKGYFFVISFFIVLVAVLKACMFYHIIKILHDKKLDMALPFSKAVGRFVFILSYFSLLTGAFCLWGSRYSEWLEQKGVAMPDTDSMGLEGPTIWLFMGIILFVIGHIFKRGIEMQTENELTV